MRIIAGKYKGRALYCPRGPDIRPTSDKARGALFNIIGPSIVGAAFLDMFAGTGAVGLEALSRGAAIVYAVERDTPQVTRKNAEACGAGSEEGYTLIQGDFFAEARRMRAAGARFDFLFADPPWDKRLEEDILQAAAPLLAEGGWVVLELNKRSAPPDGGPYGLTLKDTRRYGEATFHFYSNSGLSRKN